MLHGRRREGDHAGRRWLPVLTAGLTCLAGCANHSLNPFAKAEPPAKAPGDSMVLRVSGLEEAAGGSAESNPDMVKALDLFREQKYAEAEKICHKLAEKTKDNALLAEKARFHEAECLYQQKKYPKACDTYARMLNDHGSGVYREQGVQRMFDIANFWLEDTRQQMRESREVREGKRWVVGQNFVHWDRAKPLVDQEGRALQALEQVRYSDISGPLADKSLFLMGSVHFYNENFRESDHYFTQLVEMHPNSPFAPQATQLAIISKHMCTGGADYDGRKVAEARDLVHRAQMNYPELVREKSEFMERQLVAITLQQAEKDYKTAEFYRRTGKPCPAYFMFEVVRRRYPGTKYADLATEQMHQLRARVEQENGGKLPDPESAGLPGGLTGGLRDGMPLGAVPAPPGAEAPGRPLIPGPAPGASTGGPPGMTPPRPLPNLDGR